MNTSIKLLATSGIAAFLAIGSVTANAQADGSNYHPLQLNSPDNPAVDADARAAAHNASSEPIGQATSGPARTSKLTRAEVRDEAIRANHTIKGEPLGQSTMAAINGQAPK